MRNQLSFVLFMVTAVACGSDVGRGLDASDSALGTGGQAGGTSGATGGASGSGGASNLGTCEWKGKTYALGESFQDDCNTCTCGSLGDTLVRCTVMACFDGGIFGSGGAAGSSSSGGVTGTGGTGRVGVDGGDLREVGEASYCAPCVDEGAANMFTCPAQRPATADDLKPVCTANLGSSVPMVTVSFGDCAPLAPLPGCNATAADDTVLVLSVDLGSRGGFDCHYSRNTGALMGQTVSADSPHYCSGLAYVATTSGVTNAWCRAGGANRLSVTCATDGGSGIDGGSVIDGGVSDAPSDAAVSSACSACAADELCVAYYDGTCKPMQSTCNKVSAETRRAILVNHERCFAKPIGDEICGTRDGQPFWGCGEPPCPNETLPSDVNCYGP